MARDVLSYIECHAFRHDWDEVSFLKEPAFGVAQDWRCTNCTGIKRELWSRHGVFISRSYYMPKDYKSPPGVTKADYRKVWFDEKFRQQRKLRWWKMQDSGIKCPSCEYPMIIRWDIQEQKHKRYCENCTYSEDSD